MTEPKGSSKTKRVGKILSSRFKYEGKLSDIVTTIKYRDYDITKFMRVNSVTGEKSTRFAIFKAGTSNYATNERFKTLSDAKHWVSLKMGPRTRKTKGTGKKAKR